MKPTLLWSLTALCGVLGGWVWWNGGWGHLASSLGPIRLTKVVWVTNEVSGVNVPNPWSEPLKPLVVQTVIHENTPYWVPSADGLFATNYRSNPVTWTYLTNNLTIRNATDKAVTVNYANSTNFFTVNPLQVTYMTNIWIYTNAYFVSTNWQTRGL